jgi:hypothetical protein
LVLAMAMGTRVAAAQVIDPSTGIMVDAATDPMDFSAIMSGQPTNVGLEAGLSAAAQAQADMNANMAASQSMTDSMNAADASDDTPSAPVVPALPRTPNPVIAPGGGAFKGSVQVTIADSDGAAAVFYTTDGKKPTTSSQRYAGPILVSASKTKVQALAFDVNMQPSGVVSKTFRVKS